MPISEVRLLCTIGNYQIQSCNLPSNGFTKKKKGKLSKSDEGKEKTSIVCEKGISPQLGWHERVSGNVEHKRISFEVKSSGILGCTPTYKRVCVSV